MASERTFHLTSIFFQPVGREGKEREKGKPNLRGRVRERERDSTFYLDFSTIGPSVSGEVRGKIILMTRASHRDRSWGSFDKLREVGVFSYLV